MRHKADHSFSSATLKNYEMPSRPFRRKSRRLSSRSGPTSVTSLFSGDSDGLCEPTARYLRFEQGSSTDQHRSRASTREQRVSLTENGRKTLKGERICYTRAQLWTPDKPEASMQQDTSIFVPTRRRSELRPLFPMTLHNVDTVLKAPR
jgi:hypothetical protein